MIEHVPGTINWTVPWADYDQGLAARSVKSAERTLALFELFALHQCPLTIGQIAKLLDVPQPSTTMLVRNLVRLGYVEHDRVKKTYIPTVRIMLLGSWIHRRYGTDTHLEALLEKLRNRVGETVLLGIQNGTFSQYVSAQSAQSSSWCMDVQSGMLRPLTRTAVGRILLSMKTDAEISLLVRRCNAEAPEERMRVVPSEFMELIARTRAQGFGETCGDMRPGHAVIAVAVPCPVGSIPLAIGVGASIERVQEKRGLMIESLRELQFELASRAMGEESSFAA